ncbi:1,2-phenylacetyl-CoA epoxidase subunit PaaE [Noviherbaspirillum sp. ST9]|uniref:1,2-phenylacetyl-CoA epoxidase subunit PaaE n=1 Tax=Noviherbaspirillum sp. ST9 TaxID=3401606 RepID=UPI003B588E6B
MSTFHRLTVAQVQPETRDAVVVSFDIPDDLRETFRFTQGQYLTLRATIDGEEVRRSYSICSAVQEDALRVAIKHVSGGVFSTWANTALKAGASLDVMPPEGRFHAPLDKSSARHYLAIAAGSGITPLISIIKTTLHAEPGSRFTLVYGNRSSSSVIFKEALADLKDRYMERFRLVHVLSREHQDVDLFNGRLTRAKCEELFRNWIPLSGIDLVFICGPGELIREASEVLTANGMPAERIKVEMFSAGAPTRKKHSQAAGTLATSHCAVTVISDGARMGFTMEKDKESVLDAALRQGIDLRYSCKAGVCSTCRCKVLQGKVDMDVNYALEDYEVAHGFALSCQSFPVTDELVLDFDQGH